MFRGVDLDQQFEVYRSEGPKVSSPNLCSPTNKTILANPLGAFKLPSEEFDLQPGCVCIRKTVSEQLLRQRFTRGKNRKRETEEGESSG